MKLIVMLSTLAGLAGMLLFSEANSPETSASDSGCLYVQKLEVLGYPPIARQLRIQGEVKAVVSLAQDGTVESVSELRGPSLLQEQVKKSLQGWVFGGCIATHPSLDMSFKFSLQGKEAVPNLSYVVRFEAPDKVEVVTNPFQGPTPDVQRPAR